MFGLGTTNSLTMDKPHPDSLLDTGVQGVIGKPLDRIDGPLKVTGTATYAAEYQFANMAYGVLVGTKISAGKVVSIDIVPELVALAEACARGEVPAEIVLVVSNTTDAPGLERWRE